MPAVQQLDDPEGPHQLRVGLRRLRSALSVFSPVLQSAELQRLSDEARWLGEEVGRLRDLDVRGARHRAQGGRGLPGRTVPPGPRGRPLTRGGRGSGTASREPNRARAQAFLIDLVRFVEMRGWFAPQDFGQTERLAAPVAQLAEIALNRHWKKLGKRAHGLQTLDAVQRHELRKQAKKLRYAVEFFAPLYPTKRVEPFVKRLKALQTAFGDLNDAATVKAMFAGAGLHSAAVPEVQRALGWVAGASQVRAECRWTEANALWRNLEGTRPFWK